MEFSRKTPEECGIPSRAIKKYLEILEESNLSMHSLIMARGNNIFFEKHYAPFDGEKLHREYSVSKSFVSLAVGFAVQEGLMSLDDPIKKYFPDEAARSTDPLMGEQTVRQMLKMSTPKKTTPPGWIERGNSDRVLDYFENVTTKEPLGSRFEYDSSGSFVVGAAVEKVTGLLIPDYLQKRLFCHIGDSEDIRFLKCPGGHSWGDSAMLARPADLLRTVRFLLDGGAVGGEQILDKSYVSEATGKQIENGSGLKCDSHGYGYLIWRTCENSFFFNGMGAQLAIGSPDKDMIFIVNSNNQGNNSAKDIIMEGYFENIYGAAGAAMAPCDSDYSELCRYADSLSLWSERGRKHSPSEAFVSGKRFALEDNKMGIKYVRLTFEEDYGLLEYANAQGEKSIPFGLCRNVFGVFPEEGYSREVGGVSVRGNYYSCAASAAWKDDTHLSLTVQITDEYLGRCVMSFAFSENALTLNMRKAAEGFMQTYSGEARGYIQD